MKWGEAMHVKMEDRTLFYSPVLEHWRVKKWTGKRSKSLIYDGTDFMAAFDYFLDTHTAEKPHNSIGTNDLDNGQSEKPITDELINTD